MVMKPSPPARLCKFPVSSAAYPSFRAACGGGIGFVEPGACCEASARLKLLAVVRHIPDRVAHPRR
jgi:hypothetical protein